MKRSARFLSLVALLTLALVAPAPGQASEAKTRAAIDAANRAAMEAVAQQDAAAVAALYTEDAQCLPPNSDAVTGRDAIQEFWQGGMTMGITGLTLETVEVIPLGGRMTYEAGRFEIFNSDGDKLEAGKYIVIWKTEGKDLKLYRDIWNSSNPLP